MATFSAVRGAVFLCQAFKKTRILDKYGLETPKTYEDLLKPEYKDLIAMPDPKTSGTGYAFFLNAVNIMGEEKAIQYFKA